MFKKAAGCLKDTIEVEIVSRHRSSLIRNLDIDLFDSLATG
jgi:hypothetical protein